MTAHAKLSASGAHRWMACPASVKAEEPFADEQSSYAAEGSAAHDLAEQCLRGGLNPDAYLGDVVSDFVVEQEMIDAVQLYVDYVRDLGPILYFEQRVDFSTWVPDGFGTADAIAVKGDTLHVVDLKYGKGVRVEAENNPQGMLYALGAWYEYGHFHDVDTARITIVQPRLDHISEWDIPLKDLHEWGRTTVNQAATEALSDAPEFTPGEKQCRFCRARGTCRALADFNTRLVFEGFQVVEPPSPQAPENLSLEEIAELLPLLSGLKSWAGDVENFAFKQALAGTEIPGHKLVEGRAIREWSNLEAAEKALKRKLKTDGAFTRKLISPAGAEKKLGKGHHILTKYAHKPEGKPTLVPETDKRPPLQIDPSAGFEATA